MGHVLGVSVNRLNDIYSFHELFVFVIHDLTEKRLFEQELRKKEHLALIGEMSAGMAHELRNPLASISGSVQYLQKQLPYQTDTHHLMQIIVTETKRLSRSIEDFLSFARDTPLNRMEFDLTALLDEVIQLSHLSSQGVFHILKDYASKEVMINADYEKMRQIVQNLLSNGLKAIEKTGTLTVSLARKKGKLRLAIKDSGIGMDSEILKEIFTPFYSNFSKGIGLGMAIVKKIVEAHRYEIEIRSEKGKGTEVILWIE
jgi:two-component system sensor histidine kinase PilS (NtrC family)